ncbi:hypothetical protein WICPIJ_001698 [Wickerhamomyces pijperi]|uniref:Uncharacterized protein n=1 Tax=Wickerhamomyces pijperi TaxID=599730 RepID=A0A9P8QCS3_WICPI|nr:hypothetical protein WICPIJ_001698 [Wickerhamomyces pijperi]
MSPLGTSSVRKIPCVGVLPSNEAAVIGLDGISGVEDSDANFSFNARFSAFRSSISVVSERMASSDLVCRFSVLACNSLNSFSECVSFNSSIILSNFGTSLAKKALSISAARLDELKKSTKSVFLTVFSDVWSFLEAAFVCFTTVESTGFLPVLVFLGTFRSLAIVLAGVLALDVLFDSAGVDLALLGVCSSARPSECSLAFVVGVLALDEDLNAAWRTVFILGGMIIWILLKQCLHCFLITWWN